MKDTRKTLDQYYEIQYRSKQDPAIWRNFDSDARDCFKSFVEANKFVLEILNNVKLSKESKVHSDFCLEYRIVERKVTTETETIKNYTVE
jgi:hypothetical protein